MNLPPLPYPQMPGNDYTGADMQALSVISTIEPEDTDEFDSLADLKEEMQAAIEGTKP